MAYGALTLDPAKRVSRFRGAPVELSAREFAVLEALMKEPGAVVSREKLEDAVYGWGEEVGCNRSRCTCTTCGASSRPSSSATCAASATASRCID